MDTKILIFSICVYLIGVMLGFGLGEMYVYKIKDKIYTNYVTC